MDGLGSLVEMVQLITDGWIASGSAKDIPEMRDEVIK